MFGIKRRALSGLITAAAIGATAFTLTGCGPEEAGVVAPAENASFSPRLTTPRVAPIPEGERTPEQEAMISARSNLNIYTTLAHHTELYDAWTGLGRMLLNGSTIPARHREMLMLRMGWLCQAPYEWAQHARIAIDAGVLTESELDLIAEGADAEGWTDFEATLLTAVDELRYDGQISDATWDALSAEYSDREIMEALFTAAQYQLVSMALNTLGVQVEPGNDYVLPDRPLPPVAGRASHTDLTAPRIAPLAVDEMTPEQRAVVEPQINADGSLMNLYATMANYPELAGARRDFGIYLLRQTSLPAQTRELLIMRTSWNIGADYEWSHHVPLALQAGFTEEDIARIAEGPDTEGWSDEQRAVLQAADDLRREAFITQPVFDALASAYDTKQLIEIVYTVGGYTMTGLALNSFGVQDDPGYPGTPEGWE